MAGEVGDWSAHPWRPMCWDPRVSAGVRSAAASWIFEEDVGSNGTPASRWSIQEAMTESDSERVAIRYVNEINRHDASTLTALASPDFRFIDSLGREVRGADRMHDAWVAYFGLFPDYQITIRDHLCVGQTVALFGTASGTLAQDGKLPHGNHWSLPAAWRAVVRNGRVVDWQVYADNTPVQKLLDART
jgi:ketosteroid isomerase-like protein